MAWTLSYNGFSSWSNLSIESIRYEPVEEDDGRTARLLRGTLRGRGLLTAGSAAALAGLIADARAAFEERGKAFSISNGTTIYSQAANEGVDPTYPRGTVEITEITGVVTAVIVFEIEWMGTPENDTDTVDDVISHWWTQRFNIDESGLSTWSVNGGIHVANYAADSGTSYPGSSSVQLGDEPDHYRALVFPTLPANFRVKSLDWAESPDGQHLIYSIVAQEHARPLPRPARRGSGAFTWRRSIESGDLLGVKSFDAELEGDANSDRGELLAALLTAASRRIIFAGTNSDQILSIEVSETDIFSRNRIGLRITARGAGNASGNPLELQPNFSLVDAIVEEAEYAEPMDPYGSALVRMVKRAVYAGNYTSANFPRAETQELGAPGAPDPYEVEETAITTDYVATIDAGQLTGDDPGGAALAHQDAPYVRVQVTERTSLRPHVIALKEQSLSGSDYPYQTESPDLVLETEYQVTRQRIPPDHVMLDVPAGCILLDESFSVSPGEVDANSNRSFHGVFRRRLQMLRNVNSAGNQVTDSATIGGVFVRFTRLVPTGLRMGLPYDPRRETAGAAAARTAFDPPAGEPDSAYALAPTTIYEAS